MEDTIGQPSHATKYMKHPSSNDFLPYKLPTITTPKIVGAIMKKWTLCVKHQHHVYIIMHSYDILGARMLWKPKEARILKNFNMQNEECHH